MKKLTAGIFTALLGLVTVNAANAAIPSTTYVDTKITTAQTAAQDYADTKDAALKTAIETDYKAADATLKSGYETADAALKSAYEAADTALDGKITANANEIAGLKTSKQDALTAGSGIEILTAENGKLTIQTKGIATSESLTDLQTRMTTAEDEIDDLQGDVQTLTTADATNLQAAKDYADGLATNYDAAGSAATAESNAKAYADSLAGNYESSGAAAQALADAKAYADGLNTTATAAIEANAAAIESNETDIASLQSKDTELANSIATKAEQSALDTTNSNVTSLTGRVGTAETDIDALETKTAGLKSLAYQDIIDNSDITDGTIAQAKITNLTTDLAAKVDDSQVIAEAGTVTNADAEIPTIARMEAALEEKMPLTTTADTNIGADGTYVLTATTEDGTTTYKWEEISRVAGTN